MQSPDTNSFSPTSFNKTLADLRASKTYAKFCSKVYGRDLSQFNALDERQLQLLISAIKRNNPQTVLDLGCGIGRITEYLSTQIAAKFTGIDFADQLIAAASSRNLKNDRLNFKSVDINSLPRDLGKFDLILSIDTLYFADDLEEIVLNLKGHLSAEGWLAIFFDYRNKKQNATAPLAPEDSSIGKALLKAGFSFQAVDFTDHDKAVWEHALEVAKDLKSEFIVEGFENVYEHRIWEAERNFQRHSTGLFRRSMFISQPLK